MKFFDGEASLDDDIEAEMNKEYLEKIKKILPKFSNLNNLLSDLLSDKKIMDKNNVFLNIIFSIENEDTSDKYYEIINSIENALNKVIPTLNSGELNSFKNKIKNESWTKYNELLLYTQLLKNNNSVEYEKITGQTNDFKLNIEGKIINIELTCVYEDYFDIEVKQLLNEVANNILSRLPDNKMLIVNYRIDELVKLSNDNSEKFKELLIKEIEKYLPLVFLEDGLLYVDSFNYIYDDLTIKELSYKNFSNSNSKEIQYLKKRIKVLQKINQDSLLDVNVEKLKTSFIDSFIYGNGKGKYVHIINEKSSWSEAEKTLETKSINHLLRRIKDKFKKNQMSGLDNPYLFINYIDKTLVGYSEEHFGLNSDKRFNTIKEQVKKLFKDKNEKTIKGIFIYEKDYTKSRFIQNPNLNSDMSLVQLILSKND
jgi:hypothetical protein